VHLLRVLGCQLHDPSHLDPVVRIQVPNPQRLALAAPLLGLLLLAFKLVEVQHRLADLGQRLHQLRHAARCEEQVLQPRTCRVGNQVGDLHGLDGCLAVQEERGCLQHGQVCDDDLRDVGALEIEAVGGVGLVGFGEGRDEAIENGGDVLEELFDGFGVYFALGAVAGEG
jgi:hypothetical protein